MRRDVADRLIGAVAVVLIFILRGALPPRGLDDAGWAALRDTCLSLVLWLTVLAAAASLGVKMVRLFALPDLTQLEMSITGFMLAIGSIGLVVFLLGLVGWLTSTALGIVLVASAVVGGLGPRQIASACRATGKGLGSAWRQGGMLSRSILILSASVTVLTLVHALSPPWDYDGLMYHLVGPLQFLEAGRIFPDPNNWYVNGPFTLEMVFTFGLVHGDDVFPKLIHLSTGIVLVLATYAAGKRWLGDPGAWISTAILMGVPTLPVWASFAYIDLGWSGFEFLALSAALVWYVRRHRRWLLLSGVLTGFAMGTKYLGITGAVALGFLVLLANRRRGARQSVGDILAFALPATLVASPWYLKNLMWLGNPVYPLYWGGLGFDALRLKSVADFLNSFGMQAGVVGVLRLAWDVYAHHHPFGTVMNQVDIPAVLFPVLFAYPFLRKNRVVSAILWVVLVRVLLWAAGSQQLRFLLPTYPAMSIGAAFVVTQVSDRLRRPWPLLLPALAVGLMVVPLVVQIRVQLQFQPIQSLLGLESRGSFLTRVVHEYAAMRFIAEDLPPGSRTLLLGDGRSYYCRPTCIPDPDHFRWAAILARAEGFDEFAAWAKERRITHVYLSLENHGFFLQHDPGGVMKLALQRVASWRQTGCLPTVYRDDWAQVLEVGNC